MRKTLLMAAAFASTCAAAGADEITLKSGIPIPDVLILQVRNSFITYRVSGGATVTKALVGIKKIQLGGADAFNKAEELMAAKTPDPAGAVKAYDAVSTDGSETWLKPLVQYRRLRALVQAGLIDRAIAEWLAIMDADGASPAAIRLQPQKAAGKGSARNAKAIKALETRLKSVKQKEFAEAIQRTLMRLYRAEGNTAKADELANILAGGPTKPEATTQGGKTPAVAAAGGELDQQLDADRVLIRPGQTPANLRNALRRIRSNLRRYDEAQLPAALLAAGKAQLLLAAGLDGKEKAKMLLDAGLNVMRVVAHFSAAPEAGEALLAAGTVNAQLGNLRAAREAYREVLKKFAGSPKIAAEAKAALDALDRK